MSLLFGSISKILSDFNQTLTSNLRNHSLFRKSKEKPISPYIILRATRDDYESVLQEMHESYYLDEPTFASLGIQKNAFMDEDTMRMMAQGMTLVARCRYDSCIVGACINESSNPWDPALKEKFACSVSCPKVRQATLFYAYLQRLPGLWDCYGTQKVFEMSYLFVKRDHRKKGIGLRLLRDSRALAADCGFQVVRCDATSAYTAKLCEKIGMKMIYELPYCNYLSKETLEPVFQPPPPHTSVKIYVDDHPQLSVLKDQKAKK
nr:unnamed protein product [Callosobruchus analis]